jgi:hypothetical protein
MQQALTFELELEPHLRGSTSHSYIAVSLHASAEMAFRSRMRADARLWIVNGRHELHSARSKLS